MSHRGKQLDPCRLPTRKSVLYENCRLLAPDEAVLCTCSRKKVSRAVERVHLAAGCNLS